MREGWEYKKIGDIATVVSGSTPQTSVEEFWGEGHYWVTPAELDDKTVYVSKTERQITDAALAKVKLQRLPKGTVLLSSRAPIGKVAICDVDMYCNQGFKNCICSDLVYNKYLFYFLKDKKEYLNSLGRGATFKEISKGIVEKVVVPLPPKPTQLSIVSELDKLNELIQIKKEQLKDYDALAQSIFYEMFGDPVVNEKGWEVKKLMEVCDVRDGTHDSPKYVESSNYMLITSKNIVNRAISFDDVNYITEEDYNNINKRSKVDNGDILMPMIGTIGNPVIVYLDNLHKFSIKNVALIKFLHNTSILNRYLLELMISESFRRYLLSLNKGGTQKFVALGTIRRMDIILPPLPLQHSFAQKIEQIERQKAAVQSTITDLETLLAARMQYWFD
jgi:restriction modification system DNA specificity domain protein